MPSKLIERINQSKKVPVDQWNRNAYQGLYERVVKEIDDNNLWFNLQDYQFPKLSQFNDMRSWYRLSSTMQQTIPNKKIDFIQERVVMRKKKSFTSVFKSMFTRKNKGIQNRVIPDISTYGVVKLELNQFADLLFSLANVDAFLYMIQMIAELEDYNINAAVIIAEEIIRTIEYLCR